MTPQRLHAELLEADQEELRAYLFGASGDATLTAKGTIRFTQSDIRWLHIVSRCLGRLGSRSWIYREGAARNVWALESSDAIYCPSRYQPQFRGTTDLFFLKGLFDAEGGFPQVASVRTYIQFAMKDLPVITDSRKMLEAAGVRCGTIHNPSRAVDPTYWRFYVNAASHLTFVMKVGSWHPRKRRLIEARMMI